MHLIDKYVSLCPEVTVKTKKSNFYLRSLEKPNSAQWYSTQPVGKNSLSKVIAKLLKKGNLDRYFTNHSLRRASVTHMFQAEVDKKIVKEITGHQSDALEKYQITSNRQKENVSKILNGEKTNFIEPEIEKVKPNIVTPSIKVSVCNNSDSKIGQYHCSCNQKSFDLNKSEQLSTMINELVIQGRTGKAKIKIEIEFSD